MNPVALTFLLADDCARLCAAWPAFGKGIRGDDYHALGGDEELRETWAHVAGVPLRSAECYVPVLIYNGLVLEDGVIAEDAASWLERKAMAWLPSPKKGA